jgi:hypothetical protein
MLKEDWTIVSPSVSYGYVGLGVFFTALGFYESKMDWICPTTFVTTLLTILSSHMSTVSLSRSPREITCLRGAPSIL